MMEEKNKIIPLPKNERTCIVILGDDNEVKGYINKPRKNLLGGRWVASFQDGLEWLAKQDMTGEQWRVFAYLMSKLDFDNFLKIQQKDICEALQLNKSNVSKAIKRIIELDIITVGPMAGRSKTYRLNPRIAHRGAKNFQNTIIEYDELKRRQTQRRRRER